MRRRVSKAKRCRVTGKVSYRDVESAKRALATTSKLAGQDGRVPLRWYRCGYCGQFHLTGQENR